MPKDCKALADNTAQKQREAVSDNTGEEQGGERFKSWTEEGMGPRTKAELRALKQAVGQFAERPNATFKREESGSRTVALGSDDGADRTINSARLIHSLGSVSNSFATDVLLRLTSGLTLTDDDTRATDRLNAALALVASIEPTNELEATMGVQMALADDLMQSALLKAKSAQFLDQYKAHTNIATKAMRAFALHAEALAKLRRGGEQVVKHVHVNEGGQAVIAGTVNHGGRGHG